MSFISCRDKIVDFHWNASDPWTIVSVSDDCDTTGGGGTLQVPECFYLVTFAYFKAFVFLTVLSVKQYLLELNSRRA